MKFANARTWPNVQGCWVYAVSGNGDDDDDGHDDDDDDDGSFRAWCFFRNEVAVSAQVLC